MRVEEGVIGLSVKDALLTKYIGSAREELKVNILGLHALDTEFALSVQPERQPHHRPNHVVAPRILVAAPHLAIERLPKYLPHLPQYVF